MGIWIYHTHHKYRYLAYLLFSLSIQLKIYPAIFILLFVTDWGAWKNNLKRLAGLGAINFALLFVLGPKIFADFLRAVWGQADAPYIWQGNHSIRSFIKLFQTTEFQQLHIGGFSLVSEYSGWIQLILLAFVVACILLLVYQAHKQKAKGLNPQIFLACTLGALLLPSVSHDYKLSILAAPVVIFLESLQYGEEGKRNVRLLLLLLVFVFSLAYSAMLFFYTNKPIVLCNNCPVLLVMLLLTVLFSLLGGNTAKEEK